MPTPTDIAVGAAAEPLQLGPRPVVPDDDRIQDIAQRKEALKQQMEMLELEAAQASLQCVAVVPCSSRSASISAQT